jgi:AI-2 transport protein TqsA
LILSVIAVAASLYWLRPVMIPFILAVFIWLGLSAIIDFQTEYFKLPRALALPTTLAIGVVSLFALGSVVSASVGQLSQNSAVYGDQISQLLDKLVGLVPEQMSELRDSLQVENIANMTVSTVTGVLANTTNAILGLLSQIFLVSIFVIFLGLGGRGRSAAEGTWAVIESRIKTYLVMKVVVSAVTGLLVGAILYILDVPLALVFGLFAFLLNFIPNVGSVIATLLPLPVVIGTPDLSLAAAALAILLPGAIQLTVGNFVEPKLMGSSLDLDPVAILIALIFWGMLWGITGMLLATPITAMLKILLDQHEASRPIAELLAGRLDALRSPEASAGS